MTAALAARRLVLSTDALEQLRRRVLEPPLTLPPGFALDATGPGAAGGSAAALADLRRAGAVHGHGGATRVHPSVAGDLLVLAAPEVAVTVRAARPGLEVTACLALSGVRGAALLRTGATAVELSAFAAVGLAPELARVVPAPSASGGRRAAEVPLDRLLDGSLGWLRRAVTGTLHASVLAGARPGLAAGVVGSIDWVWDGAGWLGLEPLPARAGRPWVRLVPVGPADLASWVAPLVGAAA